MVVDDSLGNVSITGMEFSVDGYTLTGDALTLVPGLNDVVTIYVDDDASSGTAYKAIINNTLVGNANVSLMGPGTLVLTGNNTYSGWTSIAFGTLQLGNGGTSGSVAGDIMDSTSLVFDRSDAFTYGGVISRFGSVTQAGTGTLTLTGVNTYSGQTTINGGSTLALAGTGSLVASSGVLDGGTFDISGATSGATVQSLSGTGAVALGGQTLTLSNASGNFSGVISGSGALTLSGGSEILLGTNTYSGGTNINGGLLQISSDANLGATNIINDGTGLVTIDNGTLQAGGSFTLSHQIDIENTGYIDTNGYAVTLAGALMSSGTATFAKEGAGTLTFAGYAGTCCSFVDVDVGTLALLTDLGMPTISVAGGATFDISQISPSNVTPSSILALNGDGTVALGNRGLDITNPSGTFSGVIADGGIGGGNGGSIGVGLVGESFTWILNGANTYSGGTSIEGGTLALAGNGSIGSGTVSVDNGGILDISAKNTGMTINGLFGNGAVVLGRNSLTVNEANNLPEFAGVISGTGGLVLSGGTLTLTGANTYSGGTTVDAGATLQLGNSGPGGSVVGDIVDNGSVMFEQGANVTYGGAISGTGSLMQDGTSPADTLILTGANTYSGVTEILGGRLQIGDGGTSGLLGTGLISDFGELVFDHSDNVTFGGNITGDGSLEQSGTGTLILTGTNTFTGGVTVNAGILQATTTLPGNVVVNGGGTLDAVPGVGGNLGNAGKVTVHGGDTALSGAYTNASAGILAVSLGSKLAVTGTATLNGGTLEVTGADPGYVANTHTDVLTATGGVTGTFSNLVKDSGVVFTSTTIGYGPNDVWLDTTGLSITAAAASMGIVAPAAVSAAQRVQDGFETINAAMASGSKPSPDVLQGAGAIQQSATPAVAQATLTSLSGQLHAASAAMLFNAIDAGSQALSEHFDDLVGGRAKAGVWYGDLGSQGNLQRGGYAGATFRSDGGMTGADMRVAVHGVFGFAVGQGRGFGQLDAAWDHNRTWTNSLALYGGVVNGSWYANAQIAGGWYREDMQRLLQLGGLGAQVGNGSTGSYVSGALEGGRLFHFGAMHVTPFADVRYQRLNLGGFTEQGGLGYGLTANAHAAGRLQAGLGVRAEQDWRLANGMRMAFDGSAGWQHALNQYGGVFDASFTGFNDWLPVEGIGLSRNTAILRAGLSWWPTRNFGLRVGYMREQDQRERAGSAMLQGTVAF